MKWAVITIGALAAIVALVAIVGWLLPVAHVASRSARFNQPAEAVYAAVSDVTKYAEWVPGVSRIEMLESTNGRIRYRQHSSSGPLVMEVEESLAPSRFVGRIADPDQPFGGTWTFEVAREGGGSRLTITERGEVYNPIFRFMSRFVFGHTATIETFLVGLGKKFGEEVSF